MKKGYILFPALLVAFSSYAQENLNVSLVGHLDYPQDINEVWGYTAPDGGEYALVGLQAGVSVVSLADPAHPEELHFVPGASSDWRDIKTWGEYAYVTNETGNGLMAINLSGLPEEVSAVDWQPNLPGLGTLSTCRNIFIDEFGYAYLSGCNLNEGGLIFVDVFSSPGQPVYAGRGRPVYAQDVYVRNNLAYSADFQASGFSIQDVTDKSAPQLLATQPTPFGATYSCWLSGDGTVLFTTDRIEDAPVTSYDVSDPDNIRELDRFRPFSTLGEGVVPHNVSVKEGFLVISYHTDGCIIVDARRPANLIEVGNYDTFSGGSGSFSGVQGAYPFLPSGLIIVSDRGNGLFVLQPEYVRACYLEGKVVDAQTQEGVSGARVEFPEALPFTMTGLDGAFYTGIATAGSYPVLVSGSGYEDHITTVSLQNGQISILNVELQPLLRTTVSGRVVDENDGAPVADAKLALFSSDTTYEATTDSEGNYQVEGVFAGEYEIAAGKWGYRTKWLPSRELNMGSSSLFLELEKGYEDIFMLDLGWWVTGSIGRFELAVPPLRVIPDGQIVLQPGEDSPRDPGNGCYFTGNTFDFQNGVLSGGNSMLISPLFDLSRMNEPIIAFDSWFLNVDITSSAYLTGDDEIRVRITNGEENVEVATINPAPDIGSIVWQQTEINVSEFITLTDRMKIIIEAVGDGRDDVTEVGIDNFRVLGSIINTSRPTGELTSELHAFPNPSSHAFRINYKITDWSGPARLRVLNLLGQEVERLELKQAEGQVAVGRNLEPGVYFVQLQHENQLSTGLKLLKK